MEAGVIHRLALAAGVVALLAGTSHQAAASGCDLSEVVGYQLIFGKTIEAYIENGAKTRGFDGCVPDRVLVFTDNTGVRCKSTMVQHLELPQAYLFARSQTDLKLCVDDVMYDVAPVN
ncbi:MAG TPA: hypothetical protein VIG49_10480 [Acetobacteraceae bacterium]